MFYNDLKLIFLSQLKLFKLEVFSSWITNCDCISKYKGSKDTYVYCCYHLEMDFSEKGGVSVTSFGYCQS